MTDIRAEPILIKLDGWHCVTRDPAEAAVVGAAFLDVCDDNPIHVICSIHCPEGCGGHMVCDPCYRLGISAGVIKDKA